MSDTLREAGATFKVGVVSEVSASACQVRVTLPDYDNLKSGWLPVLQPKTLKDRHYFLPDVGEHVAVLLDGRGEDGVVLGAIYSTVEPPPVASGDKHHVTFADGASIEYDRAAHQLTVIGGVQKVIVEVGAEIVLKAGTRVTVDTPDTQVTGNMTVQGKLTYQAGLSGKPGAGGGAAAEIAGDVQVRGGDLDVDGHKFLPHNHPDAQGGDTGPVN